MLKVIQISFYRITAYGEPSGKALIKDAIARDRGGGGGVGECRSICHAEY